MDRLISVTKGDNYTVPLIATDPHTGAVINITGYTAYFYVKKNPNDPDSLALIAKSTTSHSSPSTGVTSVALTTTDTNKMPGTYYWGFKVKSGAGVITTVRNGQFEINDSMIVTTS